MTAEVAMADSARRRVKRKRMLDEHGWVCHLCGYLISPEFQNPHPESMTIDHLTPISMGGAKWDVANMRPAHKSCNEARGNESPSTERPAPLTHCPIRRFGC